ncbi:hypothetical protein PFNF54_00696 [Plasmodium falciparum NF54]|uniref:Uncharacterized protein n=1 Tax=Plasmodium falciparum (isolate NF54) TaxID=5843 RepID=W7KLS5_PLAFO|nr:hypothetical protein PFNF54_00696 [Plasmodium falciparum NF54]
MKLIIIIIMMMMMTYPFLLFISFSYDILKKINNKIEHHYNL